MSEASDNLAGSAVEYQLSILRVEAGMRKKLLNELETLEADLVAILAANKDLSPSKKKQIEEVIAATNKAVAGTYKQIEKLTDDDLEGVAQVTTKKTVNDLSGEIGVSMGALQLTPDQLTQIVKGPLIEGNPIKEWWNAQATGTQRGISGAVRQGMLLGEDIDSIARRIRGTKAANYSDGILAVSRREAQAIARTAVQSVANQAKLETLKNSSDVVKGVEWVSTLDNRTTPTCRALDGLQWRLPDFEPIDHDKAFPGPIAHWGCRSTQIAVTRSWSELAGKPVPGADKETFERAFRKNLEAAGKTPEEIKSIEANQRASMDGTVSSGLDFDAWARKKGDAFIADLLGPGRFALWKENNLSMRDLTDQTGRELTIAQLKDAIDNGFPVPETEGLDFLPYTPPEAPPAASPSRADTLNAAAAQEIEKIIADPKGKGPLAAALKALKKSDPEMAPSVMLQQANGIVKEKNAAKAKAAALTNAKKKILEGGSPTAAQQTVIDSLEPEEAAAWKADVDTEVQKQGFEAMASLLTKVDAMAANGQQPGFFLAAPEWKKLTPDQKILTEKAIEDKINTFAATKIAEKKLVGYLGGHPLEQMAYGMAKGNNPIELLESAEFNLQQIALGELKSIAEGTGPDSKVLHSLLGTKNVQEIMAAVDPESAMPIIKEVEAKTAQKVAAKALSTKLSAAKKKLVNGKAPSPAEQAAIDSLDPDDKAEWLATVEDAKSKATVAAVVDTTKTATAPDVDATNLDLYVPSPDSLRIIKTLSGSTRPTLRIDDATGKQWVVKSPDQGGGGPEHLKTEALADSLYRIMGARVPGSKFITGADGNPYKVAEYLDGAETLGAWEAKATPAERAAVYSQLHDHFVMDALLGNWDVAGQSNDNIMVLGGKAIRIDNGGSLDFRAMGTKKTAAEWKPEVIELKTLRDPNKAAGRTSQIFAGVTQSQIDDQIVAIVAKRDELLEAVRASRGKEVADVLGKRIDWLAKRLPAEKKKAPLPKVAPAADSLEARGLTQARLEKGAATRFGVEILAGADTFEDQGMTVWRERLPDKSEAVKMQGALTQRASDAFIERLKAAGVDVSEGVTMTAKTTAAAKKASSFDSYWSAMEAAGKTIGSHANDGKYNPSTIATYEATKKQLLALKASLPAKPAPNSPDEEKGLLVDYYLNMAKTLDEAMAQKVAPAKKWPQFELREKKAAPGAAAAAGPVAPQPSPSITIERLADGAFSFTTKEIGPDGILVDNNGGNFTASAGRAFVIKSGNVEIKVVPYRSDATYTKNARSLQGQVRVTVKGNDTTAATTEAFRVLQEAGFDVTPPTQAQREILYIHKTLYLRDDHNNPVVRAIMNSADSDETKVDRLKDWVEDAYKVKLPRTREKWGKFYNPDGEPPTTEAGRRIYRRIDVTEKQADAAAAKTKFYHTGNVEAATLGWLTNGGWVTTTVDRLRTGVPMNAGASWQSDYNAGGGNYLYTNRINKDQSVGTGFYFKGDLITRVDLASHTYDSYGEWSANEGSSRRRDLASINKPTGTGYGSNTGLFKSGMSMADIDHIRTTNPSSLIAQIKAAGFDKWVDGRELTEVIKDSNGR